MAIKWIVVVVIVAVVHFLFVASSLCLLVVFICIGMF